MYNLCTIGLEVEFEFTTTSGWTRTTFDCILSHPEIKYIYRLLLFHVNVTFYHITTTTTIKIVLLLSAHCANNPPPPLQTLTAGGI